MSMVSLVNLLTTLLLIAVPVVAAILVAMLTHGRARVLGVIGFAIFAVEALMGGAWILVVPRLVRDTDVSIPLISGVYSVARSLLAALGLLLLAIAVVTAGRVRQRPDLPRA